jgi:hypothetical protein
MRSLRAGTGVAAAILVGVSANVTLAQTPADGWSGQVQCVINVRASGYEDDQTHTWTLTGAAVPRNDFRDYPAVWTVIGTGKRAPAGTWTRKGSSMSGSITLYVPVGTNTIRVVLGARWQKAAGGIQGTTAAVPFTGDADEWRFQYFDTPDATTRTSLSGSRTQTRTDLVGWLQPANATVTETCSWNFEKGSRAALSKSLTLAKEPIASESTVLRAGTLLAPAPRTIALAGFTAAGATTAVAARTITLPGFTAAGTSTSVASRTITLAGFTATGTSSAVAPRTIRVSGFTAAGAVSAVVPRTITLTGFTAVGSGFAAAPVTLQKQR